MSQWKTVGIIDNEHTRRPQALQQRVRVNSKGATTHLSEHRVVPVKELEGVDDE